MKRHNHTPQHKQGYHALKLSYLAAKIRAILATMPAKHKPVALTSDNSYTENPKTNVSDLPSREILAFFVPDVCPASQAGKCDRTTPINPQAYLKHGGNTVYDGVLYKIKEPFGEYVGRLLTLSWEIPVTFFMWHKPKTTLGGSHHD